MKRPADTNTIELLARIFQRDANPADITDPSAPVFHCFRTWIEPVARAVFGPAPTDPAGAKGEAIKLRKIFDDVFRESRREDAEWHELHPSPPWVPRKTPPRRAATIWQEVPAPTAAPRSASRRSTAKTIDRKAA
jgi:hypothetical protein